LFSFQLIHYLLLIILKKREIATSPPLQLNPNHERNEINSFV
jgi:hypothetical protein